MNHLEKVAEFNKAFGIPYPETFGEPTTQEFLDLKMRLVSEELKELKEELIFPLENRDTIGLKAVKEVTDLYYVVLGAILALGLEKDFDRAFDEVHRSNMSKLGEDGKPIYREDGKVLKSGLYSKADLTFLNEKSE